MTDQDVILNSEIISHEPKSLPFFKSLLLSMTLLWEYRITIWFYFRRDFVASYRVSMMGFVWKLVMPLVPISIYVMLQRSGVLKGAANLPKAVYVVIGFSLWDLFATTLNVTTGRIRNEMNIISKARIPLEVIFVSGLGQIIFDFGLRCMTAWLVMFLWNIEFSARWFFLPLLAMPLLVAGFGVGILCSFFAAVSKDVAEIVAIILRYGMFVSATIFPLHDTGWMSMFVNWNPIYHLIDFPRAWITRTPSYVTSSLYMTSAVIGAAICLFAIKKIRDFDGLILGEIQS